MISDVRGWGLIIGIEINPACAFAAPEVRVDIVVLSLKLNHHPSALLSLLTCEFVTSKKPFTFSIPTIPNEASH
jgi:acetylornithine/succinyldiaminopimelate/putrescine aminotransferase